MTGPSPATLILARVEAFRRCEFGDIYDSYHADSNFRRQFPGREEYIRYGWATLGKDFRITGCRILREEIDGDSARVIHLLEFELNGHRQRYAELVWLAIEGGRWACRCAQKLTPDEWPVAPDALDFVHFTAVADKVLY